VSLTTRPEIEFTVSTAPFGPVYESPTNRPSGFPTLGRFPGVIRPTSAVTEFKYYNNHRFTVYFQVRQGA
jgi:hypothetical protein